MIYSTVVKRILVSLLSALFLLPVTGFAEEEEHLPFSDLKFSEPTRHFSDTQECVEPEDDMRKNHMEYLLHQRDETVYDGIRTRRHSLEECINCHASKNEEGEFIPVNEPDQFCASCHTYASVNIDCFQCHATKPERSSTLHKLSSGTNHHRHDDITGEISEKTLRLLALEDTPQ